MQFSRRRLITAGGSAALAAAFFGPQPASAWKRGEARSPWAPEYDVVAERSTLQAASSPAAGAALPTGAFYMTGRIYPRGTVVNGSVPAGTPSIGSFRSTGWISDGQTGAGFVTQAFELAGRGEIMVSGLNDSLIPIIGGGGEFRGARGQALTTPLSTDNLAFRVVFDLMSANVA